MTTNSEHNHPIAPNLLNRDFTADAPNKVWVGDITHIWTHEGWMYLATIIDVFSRRVVGWAMRSYLSRQLAMEALQRAIDLRASASAKGLCEVCIEMIHEFTMSHHVLCRSSCGYSFDEQHR